MTERRYTDEEIATIFERAAKSESALSPVPQEANGLTLAALHEIGREAGFSTESISNAARSLDIARGSTSQQMLGLTLGVGETAEFDRPFTDQDWEGLVAQLRDTFNAKGRMRHDGTFREWTNGNLQALVEPTAGGFRLRLRTVKGDSRTMMISGLALAGVSLATAIGAGIGTAANASGVGLMAVVGVGIFAFGAAQVPSWAARRREQFRRVMASLAGSGKRIDAPRSPGD
ncbi:MAG: hypothetical protein ABIZ70_14890 [Gemmatimonadales bacterium]